MTFRRNRSKPARIKNWTDQLREAEDEELDTLGGEAVVAKGDLSRRRTIIVRDGDDAARDADGVAAGVVVAMRGLYADVDDGSRVWPCTIRRLLRTRQIEDRHPVTVGDRVRFRLPVARDAAPVEGVIEHVEPRAGRLQRLVGKRVHTLVANVDNALIVSSADRPAPKPQLIDRYIVASLAGGITPIVCMNKMDLDADGAADGIVERYARLGYTVVRTSAVAGTGIDRLGEILKDAATVLAGQSGVGKSSLLNAVQPGLRLRTGDVIQGSHKGRHTTATASLIRLDIGGYVVDTPGVRSLDLSLVPRHELEMYFVDFAPYVPDCKFPDCLHTHEAGCAVMEAVERGAIDAARYASYVRMAADASH
ncbi:MAG: ribosome small subunit-dependent GTPase A [Phycisphaerae bacterium]